MITCAVIGCGPAGIAAISGLRQHGLLVTGFEVAPCAGGIWNCGTGHSSFSSRGVLSPITPSMRCVLPKDLMAFSGRPLPLASPHFPHHSVVDHYLKTVAEQTGVNCVTRFNTKVTSVRWDVEALVWRLITVNVVTNDAMEWQFDRVLVCAGHTQAVRVPDFSEALGPYLESGGEAMHSCFCKNYRDLRRKHVVVVGDGVSAHEAIRELKRHGARRVTHSSLISGRRTAHLDDGEISSKSAVRATAGQQEALPIQEGSKSFGSGNIFSVTKLMALARFGKLPDRRVRMSSAVTHWLRLEEGGVSTAPDHSLPGTSASTKVEKVGRIVGSEGRSLIVEESGRVSDHLRGGLAGSNSKKNAEAEDEAAHDKKNGLRMIDGVDCVLFATGYKTEFPFLSPAIRQVVEGPPALRLAASATQQRQPDATSARDAAADGALGRRGLFLGTILAENPTMAFVGLQQNLMPHFLLFEAQARMAAGTFTGRNRSLLGVDIRRLPIASPLAEADDGSPTREEAEASAVQEPAAGNTGTALARFEDRLLQKHPELAALYSSDGVGLASGVYHDVLLEVSGVTGLTVGGASKEYAQELTGRWKSFLKGAAVKVFYKARSCAPLKRKEQHVLISNDV